MCGGGPRGSPHQVLISPEVLAVRAAKIQNKIRPYSGRFFAIEHPFKEMFEDWHEASEQLDVIIAEVLLEVVLEQSEEYVAAMWSDPAWGPEMASRLEVWFEEDGIVLGFRDELAGAAFDAEYGQGLSNGSPILRSNRMQEIAGTMTELLSERLAP